MRSIEQGERLVPALVCLTRAGKARWARRPVEPAFAFCLVGAELIRFELVQGQWGFDPSQPVHGIHGIVRNIGFLWLEGVSGWDDLLDLIQAAPVSEDEYAAILAEAEAVFLNGVERLAAGQSSPPRSAETCTALFLSASSAPLR